MLTESGKKLMDLEYLYEALEFFKMADDKASIELLAKKAIEEGDYFIFNLAYHALGKTPCDEELLALAEKANASGQYLYEAKVREQLDKALNKKP
jgi:DNA-binding phage protein